MLVAVDANVLLSIALHHAAARAVTDGGVELATTLVTLAEVREHLDTLARKYRTRPGLLQSRLEALNVRVYGPRKYRSHLPQALGRIGDSDPDDVDLLALALRLEIPLWTNDRDFEGCGSQTYTTAGLLRKLGIHRR